MCSVRPSLGHEGEPYWGYYGFSPIKNKKSIIVVGGGPAGLQFASIASKKGHKVSLYEKDEMLGGNILLASKVDDGAVELLRPIKYLEVECRKNNVEIILGNKFTAKTLSNNDADIIVIACGFQIKHYPLLNPCNVLFPEDIIKKSQKPGKRVVVIGGEGAGLGLAVFLLRQGDYDITIIEEKSKLGRDVNPFYLWQYIQLMRKKRVVFMTNAEIINADSNILSVKSSEAVKDVHADSVVVTYREPSLDLKTSLEFLNKKVYLIGDAKKPRRLNNAIHDGYRLGMEIS
jgi:NADPH-dependent 2,4-dienoyl-CoA reductase/sulfur reductase-like enzyme